MDNGIYCNIFMYVYKFGLDLAFSLIVHFEEAASIWWINGLFVRSIYWNFRSNWCYLCLSAVFAQKIVTNMKIWWWLQCSQCKIHKWFFFHFFLETFLFFPICIMQIKCISFLFLQIHSHSFRLNFKFNNFFILV